MEYARKILVDELRVVELAIKSSDWTKYGEALKVREKRCNELKKAIELIDLNKNRG